MIREIVQYLADDSETENKPVFFRVCSRRQFGPVWCNLLSAFVPIKLERFIPPTQAIRRYLRCAWVGAVLGVKGLATLADRLMYQLGIEITNWVAGSLPEDQWGDLVEMRHKLSSQGKSNWLILLSVTQTTFLMLVGALQITLTAFNSSNDEDIKFLKLLVGT